MPVVLSFLTGKKLDSSWCTSRCSVCRSGEGRKLVLFPRTGVASSLSTCFPCSCSVGLREEQAPAYSQRISSLSGWTGRANAQDSLHRGGLTPFRPRTRFLYLIVQETKRTDLACNYFLRSTCISPDQWFRGTRESGGKNGGGRRCSLARILQRCRRSAVTTLAGWKVTGALCTRLNKTCREIHALRRAGSRTFHDAATQLCRPRSSQRRLKPR